MPKKARNQDTSSSSHTSPPVVWVLTDDKPGNRTQSVGVAQALPWEWEEKNLTLDSLSSLPNRLLGAKKISFDSESAKTLTPPWPDIAIAAGRRLVPALRYIKKKNPACFTAYLMKPQCSYSAFDLVAVPEHDKPPALDNIITTHGSVHALTPEKLTEAAEQWREPLAHLPSPRIALLVGGNSKSAEFQLEDFHEFGEQASSLAQNTNGSLLVTTSRRTSTREIDYLRLSLAADNELFRWSPEAENPYLGFLGLADAIIVTGDSMSMCAESCSMGKPVFIARPRHGKLARKHMALHQTLFDAGLARPLSAGVTLDWRPKQPLQEAARVAQEIMSRLEKLTPHPKPNETQ